MRKWKRTRMKTPRCPRFFDEWPIIAGRIYEEEWEEIFIDEVEADESD
jgi:hypothetical protein